MVFEVFAFSSLMGVYPSQYPCFRIASESVSKLMELSLSSAADRCMAVGKSKDDKARKSRITNGKDLLPNIDGRSVIARRYRDIVSAILADQGGADRCSESRQQLIRRFAAAAVLAEQLEGRLANGEQIDIAEHATLSSTLAAAGAADRNRPRGA